MAIQVIGNVGNQGFALPMVSAFPTDVNLQYLLAWNPTAQALDYVAYTGNSSGDFGVTRDLTVSRDAVVTRNLTINGNTILGDAAADTVTVNAVATFFSGAPPVIPNITGGVVATGIVQGLTVKAVNAGNNAELQSTKLQIQATDVVGVRRTGWAAATGTATRTTFDTAAVTLPQLAERVKALLDDLTAHGLIGA